MTECELRIGDRDDSHNLDKTRKRKICSSAIRALCGFAQSIG
ncbi:hypothetical protein CFter6_4061 [Collimonas fungivorans]|uniref:Uncharacterized protein n=1 Tax=Collimonas fungivorans TaxID=158899 RepID=A0A127PFT8_9BURK|nr:hypothetical protein CFter6_4061 [Collimonas fungivorans]